MVIMISIHVYFSNTQCITLYRNELETEKVLFISDLGGLYGNGLLGLSWWTQSFKYSPTVLLRIRNTVVLLRMENLNLLPVEKGEGGLPFIRTGKEMKIGSTCTGAHRLDVNDASVTPDGRVLVTCGKDGRVVLWVSEEWSGWVTD